MFISDSTQTLLERVLQVRSEKHRRLSNNIANVDTPGYRPVDVDFQQSLSALLAEGTQSAASTSDNRAEMVETRGAETAPTLDGNTVDLDRTMAELAENGTRYAATTRLLQKRLALLRFVASDGLG